MSERRAQLRVTREVTVSTTPYAGAALSLRPRGLEMPWNRALNAGRAGAVPLMGALHPQEFEAECVQVVPEDGDILTFVFRRLDGLPLAFRAGQYVNILFPVKDEYGEQLERSYSISSAATEPWTFAVSIKRHELGVVSRWAHENLRPGVVLEMLGPVGAFHLPDQDPRARYLFLGAGAGITPLMSMIRTIHALPGRADIVLLFHGPRPGSFAFWRELEYLTSVDERISVYYSLGNQGMPGGWEWMSGRLSREMIDEVAPDANGRKAFVCGPEGYLDAAVEVLVEAGVDATSIYTEYFSGSQETVREYRAEIAAAGELAEELAETQAIVEEAVAAVLDTSGDIEPGPALGEEDERVEVQSAEELLSEEAEEAPSGIDTSGFETVGAGALNMTFLRSGLNVRIDKEQRVLDVARKAGIRIGANCQEGMCGSCKTVKVSGEVEMNHQGGIRAREIAAGKFLPCCSTPLSDLVLEA